LYRNNPVQKERQEIMTLLSILQNIVAASAAVIALSVLIQRFTKD
jgi:hypothetical protein